MLCQSVKGILRCSTPPPKCHFLYLFERPLQQFCTTVQTVINKTAYLFIYLLTYLLSRLPLLIRKSMLTITASAIGCTGKLQGLYKKIKKWEIRPRPRKIVFPEDFILKLCTRDYVGRLPPCKFWFQSV